jgi:hypothetical protein
VLADFTAMIDAIYPADRVSDALTRDADAHRAFASAQTLGMVQRPALARHLDAFAADGGPPLVLAGEPGLVHRRSRPRRLACWRADNFARCHPRASCRCHRRFIGVSAMALRLAGELARQHGFEVGLPSRRQTRAADEPRCSQRSPGPVHSTAA